MSGNGNQVPLAPSQRGPGTYPRPPTPHRGECYHPSGATGAAYMPSATGGAQASAQAALRVQSTPQPSAPPAPQQDMSKTTMAGHNYVPPQNQTPQARPQYPTFPYRAAQHGTRPNTHPRQQQSYIPSTAATAAAPVMYHPLVFQTTHMGIPQSYQQPRSQGYYQYMTPYISYTTPASHTSPYYFPSNSQQLPTPNQLQANTPSGRNNPTTMVGPQGTAATPTAPAVSIPHPQTQTHMHQTMPGIRQTLKRSHRVPIIDPVTQQDIFSDLYSNDSQYVSGDSSERQTPQPEPSAYSIVEEFTRKVNEVANQPTACETALKSNYVKNIDSPISCTASTVQQQSNAITSINNNIVKSELLTVNENKNLGHDVAVESIETPVVSAISDSPVIVPKMPMNNKQLQKNSDQPLVLDTNKNTPPTKQPKQKSKPVVPQVDEIEKPADNLSSVVPRSTSPSTTCATVVPTVVPSAPPLAPQPQRVREPRERKSEEKEKPKDKDTQPEKEIPPTSVKPNGPTTLVTIVDSVPETIDNATSQSSQITSGESTKKQVTKQSTSVPDSAEVHKVSEIKIDAKSESIPAPTLSAPTATELLSASIEKHAKDLHVVPETPEIKETLSAIQAQAKLTQSIASCLRTNQTETKMKDINLNNKTTDPDTANGNNTTEISKQEIPKEDINKNEKVAKNSKNSNKKAEKANKMANNDSVAKEVESHENGKIETDKIDNVEEGKKLPTDEEVVAETSATEKPGTSQNPVFVPKYKYTEDQWSPLNKSGKKCYDIRLLKQIKEDPMSKNKPNAPLLEACHVIRTAPMQEPLPFTTFSRPMNDSLFLPPFVKASGVGPRNNTPRETKKDGRNAVSSGKGSVKLTPSSSSSSSHKQVIHVSLSLREDVKLNETENAWKPARFKKEKLDEDEAKTQELYKKFRGILNKLTPQKFDTLLDKVKTLEINTQKRLEGVIDLVFEKAIDEPNFSEAYAAMCDKLSTLKVPVENATSPDQYVNFRQLIINKCQNQFVTNKVDDVVLKLEKEVAECTDPTKKKELILQLNEENRRVRMRSVGNVRFIGELFKLKMLKPKIMTYCMDHLIDKTYEEEKLECLCKLLTTIGERVESEVKDQLDNVFKKMQDIVDRKSNKISSRVRFMLQDVIELRRRRWVQKSLVDSQPKMMDQIQKEAEQQQRHIELMNANPMGGFRRDDGGRGKRGDGRRQTTNSFMDSNNWKTPRSNYVVDMTKLKAVNLTQKNLSNIKLAPHNTGWNHGSGTKNTAQAASNSMISLSKNMYGVLENVQTDPTVLRSSKDIPPSYHSKGASIERSTFNSRGDFANSGGSRSGSMGVRSNSGSRSASTAPTTPPATPPAPAEEPAAPIVPQEPLPEAKKKSVKSTIDLFLLSQYAVDEVVADVKQLFPPQYHAAVVTEILNIAIEKSAKEFSLIAKTLLHLVTTNTISADNFVTGMTEIFELAPDLYIDIPMLYDYLAKIIAPQIESKNVTLAQMLQICGKSQAHLFLRPLIRDLKESMGPSFVKSKWQESGLQLKDWIEEDQLQRWVEENKFEFLEGGAKSCEETKKILTPAETQSKLLQLMNADENCDCIKGWVEDNIGGAANEDWFMRALIQAICEHSLFEPESRDVPDFNQDRMNKYSDLINKFGESKEAREASCLFGIQQLIHRLEHPQGLSLEIFQYLHEQYIISVEGFIAWEESEMEPEGKGVMMKALTSFFTNIKEADNEESCSEE